MKSISEADYIVPIKEDITLYSHEFKKGDTLLLIERELTQEDQGKFCLIPADNEPNFILARIEIINPKENTVLCTTDAATFTLDNSCCMYIVIGYMHLFT